MPLGEGGVQIISGVVRTPPHPPPPRKSVPESEPCMWMVVCKTCQTGLENIKFLYTI